jgi:hypothetical protein
MPICRSFLKPGRAVGYALGDGAQVWIDGFEDAIGSA